MKTVLRTSQTEGAADIAFVVTRKLIDAFIGIDNRGPRTSGPYELNAGVSVNSALGLYEKTSLTYANTLDWSELHYGSIEHKEMITDEGTILTAFANYSYSEPGDILSSVEMISKNVTAGVSITHPIIRSRQDSLWLSGGMTIRDTASDQLGQRVSEDHVRSIYVGGTYDFADMLFGRNVVQVGVHQGLPIFGASENGDSMLSRADGRSDFTKITAAYSHEQQLGSMFSGLLAVEGQYAFTPLLAAEEFGYGGGQFGHGYDPSEITGDHGIAARLELRWVDAPKVSEQVKYVPYVFSDVGVTWDIDPVDQAARRSGSSAGIGIRFAVTDYLSGYLEVAKPLTREVALEGNKDPRVFFSLVARY